MELIRGAQAAEVILVRLDPGESVLTSLQELVGRMDLAAATIVSGSGTLEHVQLECPANMAWPPTVYAVEKQGPGLIVSAQGLVASGQVELHLSVARRTELHAGKVMPGCRVLHGVELVLLRAGGMRWCRTPHPRTGVPQIQGIAASPAPSVPPPMQLGGRPIDPAAAAVVPTPLIRKHGCLPVARTADTLVVAMADPSNPFAIDDLRQATGLRVQAVGVPARELIPLLQQLIASREGPGS